MVHNYRIYSINLNLLIMSHKAQPTLNICDSKLKYLGYAKSTQKTYLSYIKEFLLLQEKPASQLNSADFQSYLDNYKFTSISQQNQVVNAIRFLYKYGLDRKYGKVSFERPRKEQKLPEVIDKDVLLRKISQIQNLKHKAIISLAFSTGMRVSEVVNLKIADINSGRMIIHIKAAKGKKDRIVPLSPKILTLLRQYVKQYRPNVYLFNGQNSLQYSAGSCNKIVKKCIGENHHFHQLRHSAFTSMLEAGTDLRYIQSIAGHSRSTTTERYTHISRTSVANIATPI